ncbi:conserved hypothetical protein [Uncinocarpus reesii 1704]|uniref:DUF221 domain-containing protein n=1 Tax=Uncinocarpus reesii (strain UAMH 1704) TaxID=336963 RepID=C4JU92_UNCRE|nr:uncharacterized protein UREG_06031 [Uncinocarpus reesii 1704]EEP81189.1 conserved hypothetical protein [Uncinocarpus reesii 1704]
MTPSLLALATVTSTAFQSRTSGGDGDGGHDDRLKFQDQARGQRDLYTQIVISFAVGLSAFLTFCVLRPKWRVLYNARRRLRTAASRLPELPDSMFGWIPVLYKITDEEVLASAGLDAFVFLSFYKYAINFLTITFFFSLVVILPIHYAYTGKYWDGRDGRDGNSSDFSHLASSQTYLTPLGDKDEPKTDPTYLWMYVVFSYVFTGLAMYLLVDQTNKIIQIRQQCLGSQTTMTDRTIRLSGIPPELRSEEKIKEVIENLGIGKVENLTLCRDWRELDGLMNERKRVLQKLEEAWTKHLGYRPKKLRRKARNRANNQTALDAINESETTALLSSEEQAHVDDITQERPMIRLWHGPFKLRYRSVDAIDYFEEKLRRLDETIEAMRENEFPPTPLAFVTMESIAACQMAVQAILDPSPMQFVASLAPAPADVVWEKTYLSRSKRWLRTWSVTLVIGFLTVFWSLLLVPLAYLLNLEAIEKVIPQLADALARHPLIKSLVQTGLPTLTLSLLSLLVPYIYSWLASMQGMISHGDVELSMISKNFFFTFFNLFLVFTVFATASNFYGFWKNLRDVFKDTTTVAYALASSLESLAPFYINLIVLQGLGLFPFRLLEFGSVAMYPFQLMGAKTPRDYADLEKPPVFSYGFALPQTILIFIICVVYSVFPSSWLVCLFGLIYFFIGRFIYKYQLLYAMDHQQHSTGRAWPMICSRVIVGLFIFQLAMTGTLALRRAITRSILIIPLLAGTVWFFFFFSRTYDPLMKFIALRSIDRDRAAESDESPTPTSTMSPPSQWERDSIPLRLRGQDLAPRLRKYVNPNLIVPLDEAWIPGRAHRGSVISALNNNSEVV